MESAMDVAVCEYGAGNVRSVVLAFQRLGFNATATSRPEDVVAARLAVLPGVGSARSAMAGLRRRSLDVALHERFDQKRATLGICLGLQLALEESEEDNGVACLGLLPGRAVRLREDRVPRIGWAPVDQLSSAFYFAHSYAAQTSAVTALSEGIVAEAQLGPFTGVQFHPEKSGTAGARYLELCLSRV